MNDTTPLPEGPVMLQPKRPGEILRAALGLHQQRLLTLIAIAAVLVVPGGILNWQQSCSNGACRITVFDGEVVSTSLWATTAWMLPPIALLALFAVVAALSTRVVTAQLAGEDAGLQASVRSTFARPRPLLQVLILVVGSMAVIVLVVLPAISLTGIGGPLGNVVVVASLLLLVVAGLTIGVRLAVTIPAVIVEGRSWRHALSRSWSLVGGHRRHVLRTLFLAFVAISLVGTLINVFIGPLVGMLAGDGWLARTLVQAAVNALTLSYFLTVWVLLYLDLRAREEPLDLDTLRLTLGRRRRDGRRRPAAPRHLDLVMGGLYLAQCPCLGPKPGSWFSALGSAGHVPYGLARSRCARLGHIGAIHRQAVWGGRGGGERRCRPEGRSGRSLR